MQDEPTTASRLAPRWAATWALTWAAACATGLAAGAMLAAPAPVRAADEPAPPPPPAAAPAPADPLAAARLQVAAERWPQALAELKKANATASADWNNLMGYVLRKSTPPDLAGAQAHYDRALQINPSHKGALEYSGELALMKGQLPQAESRAAALAGLCPAGCEELADLRRAIERYKAAGNRWTP